MWVDLRQELCSTLQARIQLMGHQREHLLASHTRVLTWVLCVKALSPNLYVCCCLGMGEIY